MRGCLHPGARVAECRWGVGVGVNYINNSSMVLNLKTKAIIGAILTEVVLTNLYEFIC